MAVGIEPIKGVDGTGANGTPGTKGSVLFDRPVRSDCDSLAGRVARRVRPNFDGSLSSKQTFERQGVERRHLHPHPGVTGRVTFLCNAIALPKQFDCITIRVTRILGKNHGSDPRS